jgi:hypothetical protein
MKLRTINDRLAALAARWPQRDPPMRTEVAAAGLAAIEVLFQACGTLKLARRAMCLWMLEVEARFAAGDTRPVTELADEDDNPTEEGRPIVARLLRAVGWDGVFRPYDKHTLQPIRKDK